MNKTKNILFAFAGVIFPIFVGLLHTFVHFRDLVNPEIESYLQHSIEIMGDKTPIWNAWGMMSVMMGLSFIVIGILNINSLQHSIRKGSMSFITLIGMIIYNMSVIYVGQMYDANPQFYGGMLGLVMILICLAIKIYTKDKIGLSHQQHIY